MTKKNYIFENLTSSNLSYFSKYVSTTKCLINLSEIFSWNLFGTICDFHFLSMNNPLVSIIFINLIRLILFKFSPTWNCISLPRSTTSSMGENYSYLFNLKSNICKSYCWNTHSILNNSVVNPYRDRIYTSEYDVRIWRPKTSDSDV